MSDEPPAIDLRQEDGEPSGCRRRLSVRHAGELVEAGYDYRIVIDHNRPPVLNFILVAASCQLQVGEIGTDSITSFRNYRAVGSEKDCVRRIELHKRFNVIGSISGRELIECGVSFFCRRCNGSAYSKR